MNFEIPEELRRLRESTRRFVLEELMPLERQYADDPDLPDAVRNALQDKAKALGFWNFDIPRELGGGGVDNLGTCLVLEELARCLVPAFRTPTVFSPYVGPILYGCTPEQKKRYLDPVLSGDKRTAFALTEANGGSDPSRMRTTAVLEHDHYRINGNKIFITGADKADFVQLFARTGDTSTPGGGVSCFLVDRGTPGMRLGQRFELMSSDRPWEIVFEDVRVPVSQLLGVPGQGWKLARRVLTQR